MPESLRIGVEQARTKVQTGEALLVCAYNDDAKCRALKLEGSIPLSQFETRVGALPKMQEIIFYCA